MLCLRSFFFCKQKTAYEMRISDWSSDVCSSDLALTKRYAKRSPAGPPGKYRVTFTGINNGADYVRLSALLQGMSVVRGITPLRATPQGLEVDLELLTGLPGFRRMVDEDVLLAVGAPVEGAETVPGEVRWEENTS